MMNLYLISSNKFYFHFRTWSWGFFRSNCAIICKKVTVLNQNKNDEVLIVTLRRKSHRVAHEKSAAWWVLLRLLYSIQCYCQDFFCKKTAVSLCSWGCTIIYIHQFQIFRTLVLEYFESYVKHLLQNKKTLASFLMLRL